MFYYEIHLHVSDEERRPHVDHGRPVLHSEVANLPSVFPTPPDAHYQVHLGRALVIQVVHGGHDAAGLLPELGEPLHWGLIHFEWGVRPDVVFDPSVYFEIVPSDDGDLGGVPDEQFSHPETSDARTAIWLILGENAKSLFVQGGKILVS